MMKSKNASNDELPAAVRHFDELPDSAFTTVTTISIVENISPATTWRRIKTGLLPKPEPKLPGSNLARINVGKYRAMRKAREAA